MLYSWRMLEVTVAVTVAVAVGYIINKCDKKWDGVFSHAS